MRLGVPLHSALHGEEAVLLADVGQHGGDRRAANVPGRLLSVLSSSEGPRSTFGAGRGGLFRGPRWWRERGFWRHALDAQKSEPGVVVAHAGLTDAVASRTGYPSPGCVPAEPDSVSPISLTSSYLRFAVLFAGGA